MSRKNNKSGGGAAGALGLLFIIALIIKYIWWIIGALAVMTTLYVGRELLRRHNAALAERRRLNAQIAARADQQHSWVLGGDARGIYGEQGAELMRYIERLPLENDG
jgi:hypothetical protein